MNAGFIYVRSNAITVKLYEEAIEMAKLKHMDDQPALNRAAEPFLEDKSLLIKLFPPDVFQRGKKPHLTETRFSMSFICRHPAP